MALPSRPRPSDMVRLENVFQDLVLQSTFLGGSLEKPDRSLDAEGVECRVLLTERLPEHISGVTPSPVMKLNGTESIPIEMPVGMYDLLL